LSWGTPTDAPRPCVPSLRRWRMTIIGVLPGSRAEYLRIMRDLTAHGAHGIVLGCTEISLLVSTDDLPGVALYDTTALHVDKAVRLALGIESLPTATRPRWPFTS